MKRVAGAAMTVEEMLEDPVSATALREWGEGRESVLTLSVVETLFRDVLLGADVQRIALLEASKYLEEYLWPHLMEGLSSDVFVLSVVAMINEKFRERSAVFDFLAQDSKRVSAFVSRVCDVGFLQKLKNAELLPVVRFLVGSFQNLSHEFIRVPLLKLVHLPLWEAVSPKLLEIELSSAPKAIAKQWRVYCSQKSKGKSFEKESRFLPFLFDNVLMPNVNSVLGQRLLELAIDLLAQLPTRRYFKLFCMDRLLLAKLRLKADELNPTTLKLVNMLRYFLEFEVDEFTGQALTFEEVSKGHAARIARLQETAFVLSKSEKSSPGLREFALANVGSVSSRVALKKMLGQVDEKALRALATGAGIAESVTDSALLTEALLLMCQSRTSQLDSVNSVPLYPTESMLWDESVIPGENYYGDVPLALPKLNLQFLSHYDYLLRNYTLFRLEAAYDLRFDIENVVSRMNPKLLSDGQVKFEGWARQALPLRSCKILAVEEPLLGEMRPSMVKAELVYSLHHFSGAMRAEWEAIGPHDVLFLLGMTDPDAKSGEKSKSESFGVRYGLEHLRGAEVLEVWDEQGTRIRSREQKKLGNLRRIVVALDCAQYYSDVKENRQSLYASLNLVVRRDGAENTFKGVLETVRSLINSQIATVPPWLRDVFLGVGNMKAAAPPSEALLDYADTFLDADHVRESFPSSQLDFDGSAPPYKVSKKGNVVHVESYVRPDQGPFPEDEPKRNQIRFTPRQIESVGSGAREGLTLVVGPPGSGKTDVTVQIVSLVCRQQPQERVLLVTHSNAALNQLFAKLAQLDLDPTRLLRLGHGEKDLDSDANQHAFSQQGRIDALLSRRLQHLGSVARLAQSIGLSPDAGFSCSSARTFYEQEIIPRWNSFLHQASTNSDVLFPSRFFPFSAYFAAAPRQPVFAQKSFAADLESAKGCWRHIERLFDELEAARPMEVLQNASERAAYLLSVHSRVVAMTVTYAAVARSLLVKNGFRFDSLVMEEAGQVKEIESFIPMVLQLHSHMEDRFRLKRVVLIGDDNQLPPVVKNAAFERYSNLDQSLFARLIKLGVPTMLLDKQGRSRPSLAQLFSWRYPGLGNLPHTSGKEFEIANAGMRWDYQLVNVLDYQGVGEFCPRPHFFQNLGEAEYVVAVYQYLRTVGYPASKISILTTYKGQKDLIRDILNRRCVPLPQYGMPGKLSTVDKYQGQQNDIVLLSLVRTKHVGHLRDVRRLIVAMSRARLGLYVFCRQQLFQNCFELAPVFQHFLLRPTALQLVKNETYGSVRRALSDSVPESDTVAVAGLAEMGRLAAANFELDLEAGDKKRKK